MPRRVWCETLSLAEATAPTTISLLRRYQLGIELAVRPWQVEAWPDAVARLRDGGVPVGAWPMLADDAGRWASTSSMPAFVALVDRVLAAAPAVDGVVIDLEPPIATMAAWQAGRPARPPGDRAAFAAARAALSAGIARWRVGPDGAARGVGTALMPMLVAEGVGTWMQRALTTPVTGLPFDRHSVMAYTSLLEGWSRGLLGRRRAEWVLAATARLARRRFGARVGLSLGAVGAGAFGDEPAYRAPRELARDVAIARRAGITDLTLFDLGGVLRRGPPEAWLEALVGG